MCQRPVGQGFTSKDSTAGHPAVTNFLPPPFQGDNWHNAKHDVTENSQNSTIPSQWCWGIFNSVTQEIFWRNTQRTQRWRSRSEKDPLWTVMGTVWRTYRFMRNYLTSKVCCLCFGSCMQFFFTNLVESISKNYLVIITKSQVKKLLYVLFTQIPGLGETYWLLVTWFPERTKWGQQFPL